MGLFHRMLLSISNATDFYVDYVSPGHPLRRLRSRHRLWPPILINKKKKIIVGHGRARLRTTHKANELLTRAGVIADHAEQAAGG